MWTKLILLKVCSWKGVLGKRAKLKIIQKRNFLDAESVADLRGGGAFGRTPLKYWFEHSIQYLTQHEKSQRTNKKTAERKIIKRQEIINLNLENA